jgi:hypothetical protein
MPRSGLRDPDRGETEQRETQSEKGLASSVQVDSSSWVPKEHRRRP